MSEKLFAIMEAVEHPQTRLKSNLHVGVAGEASGIDVEEYGISLEFWNPAIITSSGNGFPLWWYFQFTGRRSSDLRNRYFDIVRALGLKEMWLMWEDLSDHFDFMEDDLSTIISKMKAERRTEEFADRTFEEFDLQTLLDQTPYDDEVYPYGMFYHDDFNDLFQQVDEIEARKNVIVLGLTEFEEGKIRVMYPNGQVGNLAIR